MSDIQNPGISDKGKGTSRVIVALFLIGLYFPTSIEGVQSQALVAMMIPVCLIGLLILCFRNGMGSHWLKVVGCCIPGILVLCSFISPFPVIQGGPLYSYSLLGLLYMVKLKTEGVNYSVLSRGLVLVNLISLVMGVGIILQFSPILDFLTRHYTYFYPELLPIMFALRKPVLTFGTHSVAGFFMFLFFWMNLRTYEVRRNWSSLCFALIYPIFSLFLFSFTSLFFFLCEIGFLVMLGLRRNWKATLVGMLALGCAVSALFSSDWIDKDLRQQVGVYALTYLQSQDNGLLGRYSSSSGDLAGNLAFLRENPWRPVGITGSQHLFFVDSGPIEYLIRGSLPLLLLIYSGFVMFAISNLKDRQDAMILIAAFLAFEIGFAILPFARMLFCLPFFIVYLNVPRSPQPQSEIPSNLRWRPGWRPVEPIPTRN